jgi:hypothetical protein
VVDSVSPDKFALLLTFSDPFRPHIAFAGNRTTEFVIRRSWSLRENPLRFQQAFSTDKATFQLTSKCDYQPTLSLVR